MTATTDTLLASLREPGVRDLAWACFSRPLLTCSLLGERAPSVSNCALTLNADRRRWLRALDADAAELNAYLKDARAGRLGLYFERLWQFFLDRDPAVDLIAHNLAVREHGHTLGEFDCLYFCRTRQCHVHLELAVKFYLQRPGADGSQWHHWVGPNVEDRLDRKLRRLFEHQLLLSEMTAARPVLADLGIDQLQRELEIKGRLFPAGAGSPLWPPGCRGAASGPGYYELDHLRRAELRCAGYRILDRCDWFAPLCNPGDTSVLDAKALPGVISKRFARTPRPVQVAGCDDGGLEIDRFFVVPHSWPAHAVAAA